MLSKWGFHPSLKDELLPSQDNIIILEIPPHLTFIPHKKYLHPGCNVPRCIPLLTLRVLFHEPFSPPLTLAPKRSSTLPLLSAPTSPPPTRLPKSSRLRKSFQPSILPYLSSHSNKRSSTNYRHSLPFRMTVVRMLQVAQL